MAITYHAGRRIQGLSTEVLDTVTFEDDFTSYADTTAGDVAYPTTDTAKMRVNPTNDNLDFNSVRDSSSDLIYKDLTSVSDTSWVLRFKIRFSAVTTYPIFWIGLSSNTSSDNVSQDGLFAHYTPFHATTTYRFGGVSCDAQIPNARTAVSLNGGQNHVPSISTDYYIEIARTSSTNYNVKIFSDSLYATQVGSTSGGTIAATITGLRYFKIFNYSQDTDAGALTGIIDDIEFYNGVSSLTSKPTNAQVGSRFEETDTRKMYHYEVATGDALWGKNSDQVIEDFTTYADTTEGDASWVTDNTARLRVNPTTDVFDFTGGSNTYQIESHFDIGTANISETAWVLRFKLDFTTYTKSTEVSQVQEIKFTMASGHTTGYTPASIDELGFLVSSYSGAGKEDIQSFINNGGSGTRTTTAITPSQTTYYCQLTRTSATNFRIEFFSDSAYSSQIGSTLNTTISASYTGLRYFMVQYYVEANNGTLSGTVDDIEFWNGVTTATTGNVWTEEGT